MEYRLHFELEKIDLESVLLMLPYHVREAMRRHERELILAGGFIRSIIQKEPVNDIDLFTSSEAKAREIANELLTPGATLFVTPNAITVQKVGMVKIQLIHRWTFSKPEDVIDSFDFSIAQAAMWNEGGEWKSLRGEWFYVDMNAKILSYLSPIRNEDPAGSFHRVLKFVQKGYKITDEDMSRVLARLMTAVNVKEAGGSSFLPEHVSAPRIKDVLLEARRTHTY